MTDGLAVIVKPLGSPDSLPRCYTNIKLRERLAAPSLSVWTDSQWRDWQTGGSRYTTGHTRFVTAVLYQHKTEGAACRSLFLSSGDAPRWQWRVFSLSVAQYAACSINAVGEGLDPPLQLRQLTRAFGSVKTLPYKRSIDTETQGVDMSTPARWDFYLITVCVNHRTPHRKRSP